MSAGCKCVPYETPPPLRPLVGRNIKVCTNLVVPNGAGFCIYVLCFTVHIQEIEVPVGVCRPDLSAPSAAPQPQPKDQTQSGTSPIPHIDFPKIKGEGVADVTGESKTTEPKKKKK